MGFKASSRWKGNDPIIIGGSNAQQGQERESYNKVLRETKKKEIAQEMMSVKDFQTEIVAPACRHLEMHSVSAVNLLVGTAVHESNLFYLRQLDEGPALGFFQMEPDTHDDIWGNYVDYRADLSEKMLDLSVGEPSAEQLKWNLLYSAAMARIHYARVPQPLPHHRDPVGMARYWKQHYNTHLGAGLVEEFERSYRKYVVVH